MLCVSPCLWDCLVIFTSFKVLFWPCIIYIDVRIFTCVCGGCVGVCVCVFDIFLERTVSYISAV